MANRVRLPATRLSVGLQLFRGAQSIRDYAAPERIDEYLNRQPLPHRESAGGPPVLLPSAPLGFQNGLPNRAMRFRPRAKCRARKSIAKAAASLIVQAPRANCGCFSHRCARVLKISPH